MIRDNVALVVDSAPFDEDYYVIDAPPSAEPRQPDPMDYRVVREQLLELATPASAPRFQVYWTVPFDVDWVDEN
jgi:hypothetical protein